MFFVFKIKIRRIKLILKFCFLRVIHASAVIIKTLSNNINNIIIYRGKDTSTKYKQLMRYAISN